MSTAREYALHICLRQLNARTAVYVVFYLHGPKQTHSLVSGYASFVYEFYACGK